MQSEEKQPMPSYWDSVMTEMEHGRTVTEEHVIQCYDQWAKEGSYEKSVDLHAYGALNVLEETMGRLYPGKMADVTLMDVGACTGLSGQRLHKMGFTQVDALDPSSESLRVAGEKGVYRTLFNLPMTDQPLDIPENSYDGITVVGATGPKHLPLGAFTEMIRLVKPGGFIVNLSRVEYLDLCPDYVNQWNPMVEGHVKAGRWRLVEEVRYDNHFNDRAGYRHVFEVC
ncbi:hypothetical protein ACOMHN_043274 [Nucella lapillus]